MLLDELIAALGRVGLVLNASKTVVMTTEAQPPKQLFTNDGTSIKVLARQEAHKWLGCLLAVGGSERTILIWSTICKRPAKHSMRTDGYYVTVKCRCRLAWNSSAG